MNKPTHTTAIPKLRFPEFINAGDWDYSSGDKLFKPIVNKNHNSDLPILAITQEHGAIPRDMIDYHVSVTDQSIENYKIVEIGDFIISLRSFQGGIEYSRYKGICSPAYIILRKRIDLEDDFYRHYFKSFPFIRDLNRNLEGIRDGKMITYKQFSEILIPQPQIAEQRKIADCLTSLDACITLEQKKLELLRTHKKGLLQQLFPAEGQRVPALRFPEFAHSGEWEVGLLGNITGNITTGKLDANAMVEGGKYRFYTCSKNYYHIDEYAFDTEAILIAGNGAYLGYIHHYKGKFNAYQRTYVLSEFSKDVLYLKYFLERFLPSRIAHEKKEGNTPYIVLNTITNMEVNSPPTIEEQRKIASCLASLDALIEAQSRRIEVLQRHKRGLLQGLFPRVSEAESAEAAP